jgi:hypothetical protein
MIRYWIASLTLIAAMAANGQHPVRAGSTGDFFWNMLPELTCETTVFAAEQHFEGIRLVQPERNLCFLPQIQFERTTAIIGDLKKTPDADDDAAFEKWSKTIAVLCRNIELELKLNLSEHICLFGVPSPSHPIAWSMYQLFVQGQILDDYHQGSWCLRQSPYGDERDALLTRVFGHANGATGWQQVKSELRSEGFIPDTKDEFFRRAMITSSPSPENADMSTFPSPIFFVYWGQEELPRANMVPCVSADVNCATTVAPKKSDGICMSIRFGFRP